MIQLNFTIEQLQIILRGLDQLPHGASRQIIDYIVTEANRQQQEAKQEAAQ